MDNYFRIFLEDKKFAPAFDSVPVDPGILEHYRGKLPEYLLGIWQEFGFCGFGEGRFWLVNPADYQDVVETYLKDTRLWGKGDFYAIGRSGFGELYVFCHRIDDPLTIDVQANLIFPSNLLDHEPTEEEHAKNLGIFFKYLDHELCDARDTYEKLLFKKCLKKFGRLKADEMYSFVPALTLNGTRDFEQIQKVKILPELAALCQIQTPDMMLTSSELRNLAK